jgi:hypothetical protein
MAEPEQRKPGTHAEGVRTNAIRPRSRDQKAIARKPSVSGKLLQEIGDLSKDFKQEGAAPLAFGCDAAAAITDTVELVRAAIHMRLTQITILHDETKRGAAEFLDQMTECGMTLQEQIERYARDCGDVQQQIRVAGKPALGSLVIPHR